MRLEKLMTANAKLTSDLANAVIEAAKSGMTKEQIAAALERLSELVQESDD